MSDLGPVEWRVHVSLEGNDGNEERTLPVIHRRLRPQPRLETCLPSSYRQHKFYLGRDESKAKLASLRLEQFWQQVCMRNE